MLERLQQGAGNFPQWFNDTLSGIRAHMKDVVHFLRYQASQGKHFGGTPHPNWTGRPDIDPVMYEPFTTRDARSYAAVDLFDGAYVATMNLREISAQTDEAIGYVERGAGIFPAWVEHKLSISAECIDRLGHWLENEEVEGRQYGQGAGFPTGARRPGLLWGPGQAGVGTGSGIRRFSASLPPGGSSRPPGGGSVPRPSGQYSAIPTGPRPPPSGAPGPGPGTSEIPTAPPGAGWHPGGPGSAGLPIGGPVVVETPQGFIYQPGYGSARRCGPPSTAPMIPSQMEWMMPPSRMLEVNRMRLPSRMLQQETGRKFGVPGIPPGQPGWAGAGGVAQIPHPGARAFAMVEKSAEGLVARHPKPSPPPRRGPRLKAKSRRRGRAWRRK